MRFLRKGETTLSPEELKKRQNKYYFDRMFYLKLCTMVERVKAMQNMNPIELEQMRYNREK